MTPGKTWRNASRMPSSIAGAGEAARDHSAPRAVLSESIERPEGELAPRNVAPGAASLMADATHVVNATRAAGRSSRRHFLSRGERVLGELPGSVASSISMPGGNPVSTIC